MPRASANSANMSVAWVTLEHAELQALRTCALSKPPWRWPFQARCISADLYLQPMAWTPYSIDPHPELAHLPVGLHKLTA